MHRVATQLSDMLTRYLDVTSSQLKLTAQNMANVDTPGYKAIGVDFQQAFANAMRDAGSDSSTAATETAGLIARPDGNNVSMDREGLDLAKEQLQFRTGIELLKHEYARTMSAIHVDGK